MGFLDGIGIGGRYEAWPVSIEGVRGIWTAANTRGGFSLAGGQVAVTDSYVVFSPWDLDKTREWLFILLGKAGAPTWVGKIDELITASKLLEPVAMPLAEIRETRQLNGASLLKPPTTRLTLRDGRSFDLGILASPRSPNVSRANNEAYDHFSRTLEETRAQT